MQPSPSSKSSSVRSMSSDHSTQHMQYSSIVSHGRIYLVNSLNLRIYISEKMMKHRMNQQHMQMQKVCKDMVPVFGHLRYSMFGQSPGCLMSTSKGFQCHSKVPKTSKSLLMPVNTGYFPLVRQISSSPQLSPFAGEPPTTLVQKRNIS